MAENNADPSHRNGLVVANSVHKPALRGRVMCGNRPSILPARAIAASVTMLATTVIAGVSCATEAIASSSPAINGVYRATSIGEWAKTNNSFHDEATTASTWTISSSCVTAQDCDGQVSSDQGWSAPLVMHDGAMWTVKREVPNWGTCPDGSTFTGQQTFLFFPVSPDGSGGIDWSPTLAGKDMTIGVGGACRVNRALTIEMPFRLDKIG